jgi:hypothetical protein
VGCAPAQRYTDDDEVAELWINERLGDVSGWSDLVPYLVDPGPDSSRPPGMSSPVDGDVQAPTKRRMTILRNERFTGAALLLGGLLLAVGYVVMPTTSLDDAVVPASWLILLGVIFALSGLAGFATGQRAGAPRSSATGALLCGLGIALVNLPPSLLGAFDRHALDDTDAYHASVSGTIEFLGLPILGVGVIVLAVATWRAGVYPRWAAWALIAIAVLSIAFLALPGSLSTDVRYPAEDYVLMGLLGVAMRRQAPATASPFGALAPAK